MSRKRPIEEYQKTFAYRFFRWMKGEKDAYLDNVEMKPQEEFHQDETEIIAHEKEHDAIMERVYQVDDNIEVKVFRKLYRISCIIFTTFLAVMLLLTISYLPASGTVDRPANNEVAARYIEKGLEETGAVNIVSGMILDYRAFDTLGESHVLFVATITVFILLRLDKPKSAPSQSPEGSDTQIWPTNASRRLSAAAEIDEQNDRFFEPKNDAILRAAASFLVPIIIIFGIYVILNGHLGPGGGFSGGAIIGAGLVLYLNAFGFEKTERFFTEKTYKWVCFISLSFYCLAKSYSFFTGANQMHNAIPKGTPGAILSSGLILPLNIAVGLVVACTIYAFYAMFRKGGF